MKILILILLSFVTIAKADEWECKVPIKNSYQVRIIYYSSQSKKLVLYENTSLLSSSRYILITNRDDTIILHTSSNFTEEKCTKINNLNNL